jgi:small-conductance mechanosensitive channel
MHDDVTTRGSRSRRFVLAFTSHDRCRATEVVMIGMPCNRATLALTLLLTTAAPAVQAVDLHTFSDSAKACAYIATAGSDDITKVEISLAILQRDLAGGEARDRLMSARGDIARLDGEARTVEHAVTAIEAQIATAHAQLQALRARLRAIDRLPDAERAAVQTQMRATSEELIEMSFDLRDAKARLAALRSAVAGQQDAASAMEAALSTARGAGRAIRDCARTRRAILLVPPLF